MEKIKYNQKIVYLSGMITGNPYYTKQFAFFEKVFTEKGYIVINPAKLVLDWADAMNEEERWAGYVTFDLALLEHLKGMVFVFRLPTAHNSKGASMEQAFALKTGIPVIDCMEVFQDYLERMRKEREANEHD